MAAHTLLVVSEVSVVNELRFSVIGTPAVIQPIQKEAIRAESFSDVRGL
jgi:hypothetical protein